MVTQMTDIKLGSSVQCTDGPCGKAINVVLNPATKKVSYIVVEDMNLPDNSTRLVPFNKIQYASQQRIMLNCTKNIVANMPFFNVTEYVAEPSYGRGYYYYPYFYVADDWIWDDTIYREIDVSKIPAGEIALSTGMDVQATDGKVGKVNDLVLNSNTGEITHMLIKEPQPWLKREVAIPASAAYSTVGNVIYLKINKKAVAALPTVPLKH